MTDLIILANDVIVSIGIALGFFALYYTTKVTKILGKKSIWIFLQVAVMAMLIHRFYVLFVVTQTNLPLALLLTSVCQAAALVLIFNFARKILKSLNKDYRQ